MCSFSTLTLLVGSSDL